MYECLRQQFFHKKVVNNFIGSILAFLLIQHTKVIKPCEVNSGRTDDGNVVSQSLKYE